MVFLKVALQNFKLQASSTSVLRVHGHGHDALVRLRLSAPLPLHGCAAKRYSPAPAIVVEDRVDYSSVMPSTQVHRKSELRDSQNVCLLYCTVSPSQGFYFHVAYPLPQPVAHYAVPCKFELVGGKFRILEAFKEVPRLRNCAPQGFYMSFIPIAL